METISHLLALVPKATDHLPKPLTDLDRSRIRTAAKIASGMSDDQMILASLKKDATKRENFLTLLEMAYPASAAGAVSTQGASAVDLVAPSRLEEKHLQDIQDARRQLLELVRNKSTLAWAPAVVSGIVVLGFFGMLAAILGVFDGQDTTSPPMDSDLKSIALIMLGTLSSAFVATINFWLGSSKGSADKTALLALQSIQLGDQGQNGTKTPRDGR